MPELLVIHNRMNSAIELVQTVPRNREVETLRRCSCVIVSVGVWVAPCFRFFAQVECTRSPGLSSDGSLTRRTWNSTKISQRGNVKQHWPDEYSDQGEERRGDARDTSCLFNEYVPPIYYKKRLV